MSRFALRKLRHGRIWRKILYERLTEPLHLNLLSVGVAMFGGFRRKVEFDLVTRQQHAFGLLRAADLATRLGLKALTALEFGVANGAGLFNMCDIGRSVTRVTGIAFRVVGFDSGIGMPPPRDWRDHPELYTTGDYPMDVERLRRALPDNAEIVLGQLGETVPAFLRRLSAEAPIGFVSIDVDYYSSTSEALRVFVGPADRYLPLTPVYLDDVDYESHSEWAGELRAVADFNAEHEFRKVTPLNFLRHRRLFKNAKWIDHMYALHVFDHVSRQTKVQNAPAVLDNPYF